MSVLILRPVNILASICAFIDDSKSNKASAVPATVSILTPSFRADVAALNTFSPPSFAKFANASLAPATSSNTWAGATPFACAKAPTDSNWDPTASILPAPTAIIWLARTPALSPLKPSVAFKLANVCKFALVTWPIPPKLSIIPWAPAFTSSALTPIIWNSIVVALRVACNVAALAKVNPNSLRVSDIPP